MNTKLTERNARWISPATVTTDIVADGKVVATVYDTSEKRPNAKRIIEAANSADIMADALREVDEVAYDAQGDWADVEVPYAPEWTAPYKRIEGVVSAVYAVIAVATKGETT